MKEDVLSRALCRSKRRIGSVFSNTRSTIFNKKINEKTTENRRLFMKIPASRGFPCVLRGVSAEFPAKNHFSIQIMIFEEEIITFQHKIQHKIIIYV